jgi:hypothetical protein
MADTYQVVVQYPTTEFLGGTNTQAVMAVGITTKPSEIYLEFRIPQKQYTAALVKDYGIGYSGTVEAVADIPGIDGMEWQQAPSANGQLIDQMLVTVVSDSGNSSGTFVVPFGKLAPAFVTPMVKKLVGQLNAAEAQ